MGISTSGVGSGIEIRELVDKLLESESKAKIAKFDSDEATTLAKITGLGQLKSAMSDFVDKLDQLQNINQFELRSVNATTANNVQVISATANSKATTGTYSIEVDQLAFAQKSGSKSFPENYTVVGTGTLTFHIGTATHSFDINVANQTLQGINDTINAASGSTGISSSLITTNTGTSIVFSSPTGTNNTFTVSVTDDGDSNNTDNAGLSQLASPNLNLLQAAQNSIVKIEGVPITSDSNTLSNAISGISIDLINTNVATPITLTVNVDVNAAHQAITDFVESYNTVFDTIKKLTQYDKNNTGKKNNDKGILIGDSTLRSIEFQMRRVITQMMPTQPAGFSTLSQIGITSDQYTGKLIINDQQLTASLNKNFNAVGNLFMDSESGLLVNMESFVENYVEVNGIIQSKAHSLNESVQLIEDQRISLERHLKNLEKRLLGQFIAMDSIVARLKSLSDYLDTQLKNLPEPMMFRK